MIAVVRAMPTLLRVGFASMVAYRAEMVIWILTATLPLVMLALWNAASLSGPLGGFGQAEFARYFTITLAVRQLTSVWVLWELNHDIRTGGLSPRLLRPMHPLVWPFAETLAALPCRVLVLLPLIGGLAFWSPELLFVPTAGQAFGFAGSLALALVVNWFVQCLFGVLAFWFEQSLGIFQIWYFLWALLGGYVIPLPLLPSAVRDVARWLPFHSALGAPVEILMGTTAVGPQLAIQAAWAGVLGVATAYAWRAGLRRYGAVGA